MSKISSFIFLTMMVFGIPVTSVQGIVYVNNAASGNDDGTSWTDAYTNLADALSGATDEIWVVQGTYTPGTLSSDSFSIGTNNIYGGFDGAESARSERDWQNQETILSGDLGTTNSLNIIKKSDASASARIDGFTISDGIARATGGGGLRCTHGEITIANCLFTNNIADIGGATYFSGTDALITNCTFAGNATTNSDGGAIYFSASSYSLIVEDCTFRDNYSADDAGTIMANLLDIRIAGSTFENNIAGGGNGGGIFLYYGGSVNYTNVLEDCIFTGNQATNTGSGVGGVLGNYRNTPLHIRDCVFTNNSSARNGRGGGAIYSDGGNVLMTNCSFNANTAVNSGGAIYDYKVNSTLSIYECLFSTNIAGNVGGAILSNCRTLIYNSTFASNSCDDKAGAIYLGDTSTSETNTIVDTIFFKNTSAESGGAIYVLSSRNFEGENCGFTNNSILVNGNGGAIDFGKDVGSILLSDCSFNTNTACDNGGALCFADPTVASPIEIANCVFLDNVATDGSGGAVYDRERPMLVRESTFTGNYCDDKGGAAYMYDIDAAGDTNEFLNCAFANNRGRYEAGALYFHLVNATVGYSVRNCSFFTNTTTRSGGGIHIYSGTIGVTNCVFWHNKGDAGWTDADAIYAGGGDTLNIAYSCVNTNQIHEDGTVNYGSGIINTDPLFVSESTYDLHLKSQYGHWTGSGWSNDAEHSPCIDFGDPASDFSNEPTSGARINMGAYGNTAYASKSISTGSIFLYR